MTRANQNLTLELVEHPHGRCQAILTLDDGTVLLDQIYKNRNSAQASIRQRLVKEGLGQAHITRVTRDEGDQDEGDEGDQDEGGPEAAPEAPVTAPASPAERWLLKLRQEAQKALDQASRLREQADQLEVEHKRLTAAADVLEGPEA